MDLTNKNYLEINYNDLKKSKDLLEKSKNLQLTYILIQDFFNEHTVNQILEELKNIDNSNFIQYADGYKVFPRTAFSTENKDEEAGIYFNSTYETSRLIKEFFSIDLISKFHNLFNNINRDVSLLYGPNNNYFNPFNFRIMNDKVGINTTSNIHNGSSITNRCINSTYKHLVKSIDFDNQLSFFTLLKNCEVGGEITIYSYPKNDYSILKDKHLLLGFDGLEINLLKTNNKFIISMNPGDLIIFPGGQLWHRVEPVVEGTRITLGGFLASDFDNKKWYYWI